MIPQAFEYERPESVADAAGLLRKHGDGARVLAGGHSLVPMMKLRLAAPDGADRHRRHLEPARHPPTPARTS